MQTTEEQRFTALYRLHYPDVLAYFLRRTDPDLARDAAADVFTVAWRRLEVVPTERPLPWLYGVAARVLANQKRGNARRVALADRVNGTAAPRPADPGATVGQAEQDAELFHALASLSATDREVLLLNAWEGLPASALAERFEISLEAAEKRLTRAKHRLAEALDSQLARLRRQTSEVDPGGPT